MKQVWKFPLGNGMRHEFHMPIMAKPLCVQIQAGIACIWVEVDPVLRNEMRVVWVVGTGIDIPPGCEYIGTIQQPPFVWHIYIEASK